jgi:predicted unusual protein kinase regulating ubiquinone biosynthesis (AarF/ABC1/UbiB family)
MFALHANKIKSPTIRQRRSEIVARLAALGLSGGLRLLRACDAETYERKLRLAFENLGSVFSAFGLYLSTRVDLLPADVCLELSEIADKGTPTSFDEVREMFFAQTGRDIEDAFLYFDEEPFESRLLYQKHKAWLHDGTQVTVKVIKPETETQFVVDEEFLDSFAPAFTRQLMSAESFAEATEDFRRMTRQQFDLKQQAQNFSLMAQDAMRLGMLCVPRIYKELSSEKFLTTEHLQGVSLDNFFADEAKETARLLCTAWLHQTLYGQTFPIVSDAAHVIVLEDKRIAFADASFASVRTQTQMNLRRYLWAAALDQPDRAADFLLEEFNPSEEDRKFRGQLRQIVVFRDSDWNQKETSEQLLNLLVTQWRVACECGLQPRSHLPSFYRGLFTIAKMAQRIAPDSDVLVEGLEDARLLANLSPFQEMMDIKHFGANVDKYGALLMELPHQFDEMMRTNTLNQKIESRQPKRAKKNSAASVTGLMLFMATIAIVAPQFSVIASQSWAGRIGVIVFVLCGAWLLRLVGRDS